MSAQCLTEPSARSVQALSKVFLSRCLPICHAMLCKLGASSLKLSRLDSLGTEKCDGTTKLLLRDLQAAHVADAMLQVRHRHCHSLRRRSYVTVYTPDEPRRIVSEVWESRACLPGRTARNPLASTKMGRRCDGEHWSVQRLGWHGQRTCEAIRLTRRRTGGSRGGHVLCQWCVRRNGRDSRWPTQSYTGQRDAYTPRGCAQVCKKPRGSMSETVLGVLPVRKRANVPHECFKPIANYWLISRTLTLVPLLVESRTTTCVLQPSFLLAPTPTQQQHNSGHHCPLTAPTIGPHADHSPAPPAIPAISISRAPSISGLEHPQLSQAIERESTTATTTTTTIIAPCGGSDMENMIPDDSPLAQLLQGEGTGSPDTPPSATFPQSFAPRGPSTLQSRIRDKLPQPLRIHARHGSIARIHTACSKAVNSHIGRADNERFLEQFRYLIVASQLLGEQGGLRASAIPSFATDGRSGPQEFKVARISPIGAAATGTTAFALAWLVHWSRRQPVASKSRSLLVMLVFATVFTAGYTYMRRQWLQYLRQEAVKGASDLVTNLQAFEASTSSALALIQEVELVSRGYRLSSPLPPISRIEEKGQARRCQRLRKNLRAAYADILPILAEQCRTLKQLIQEDDLEKYLDVYEISNPDMHEAALSYSESEFDDAETLKALRTLQYRSSILRRVYLCSLLAMEADGGKPDFARWSTVVDSMLNTARPVGEWSEKFNRVLAEEEQFVLPSPAKVAPTPGREKIRNSVRKLSGLSSGIRGLQAKMQVLREETNKSLEDTEDVTDLGHSLLAQYDSIGADLKSLVQAWEAGKNALALNIDRHERRISQASSGLRSPVPSLGGLTAVDEGSPSDALRALNGDVLSLQQSAPSSDQGSTSDDEVFEAIAIPKTRATMSREERMQKIQDDRARQASLREQRDASTNMLRELESVINLRPHRVSAPPAGARVTSL